MKRSSHLYIQFVVVLVTSMMLSSCNWFEHDGRNAHRTVLVYMMAENSLSYSDLQEDDIREMEECIGSLSDDDHVLVYVDDEDLPRLMEIRADKKGRTRKIIQEWADDVNSCDPVVLRQVLKTVFDKYPSQGYGLILWSHGSAWLPATKAIPRRNIGVEDNESEAFSESETPCQRSIGIDNDHNTYSNNGYKMDIAELAQALAGFPKLDFLMFDACFMQSVEVAYELRHEAEYIISSPAEIPNPGAPYNLLIPAMMSKKTTFAEEMVQAYYDGYVGSDVPSISSGVGYGVLLSVIDCSRMDELQRVTEQMVAKYGSKYVDRGLDDVLHYYPLSSSNFPEFFDMKAYMHHLISSADDWTAWLAVYEQAVPKRLCTNFWFSSYIGGYLYVDDVDEYGGVSMYVPEPGNYFKTKNEWFCNTSWYPVSGWPQCGW